MEYKKQSRQLGTVAFEVRTFKTILTRMRQLWKATCHNRPRENNFMPRSGPEGPGIWSRDIRSLLKRAEALSPPAQSYFRL